MSFVAKPIQLLNNDAWSPDQVVLTNRTGGAVAVGDVYAIDILQTATDSQTGFANALNNITGVVTANLAMPCVIAEEAVANGLPVKCTRAGVTKAKCQGTIAIGDPLKTVNAQVYFQKAAFGSASTELQQAIALEVNATGPNLKAVWLLPSAPLVRNV